MQCVTYVMRLSMYRSIRTWVRGRVTRSIMMRTQTHHQDGRPRMSIDMCEHTRPRNLRFVYCHPSRLHLSLLCAKFATGCGRQLPVNALLYGSTNLLKVVYRLVIHGPR